MINKEEILAPLWCLRHEQNLPSSLHNISYSVEQVKVAMDQYSKEIAIDFEEWLSENTEVIKEEKITLYRYCDVNDGYGNYTLHDIYLVYKDKYLK